MSSQTVEAVQKVSRNSIGNIWLTEKKRWLSTLAKSLLDFLFYCFVRMLVTLVSVLSITVSKSLCRNLALLIYRLDSKHRRIGRINLGIAFPAESNRWREQVLRESFAQLGEHAIEVCRLSRMSEAEVRKRVRYEEGFGLNHYREAKEMGKGLIFLTAHVSAWELLPVGHAVLGHPLSFIVRPLDNRFLDAWATRTRSRFGNQVLSKFGSVRTILRKLKDSEDVGILIDQNVQAKDGVFATLFGKPACTTSVPAGMALRTGAPVIAGFMLPDTKPGTYRIRFYPPFLAERSENESEDLVRLTSRFNQYVEDVIREVPHCWLWGHRRFATQPDGSNPYD